MPSKEENRNISDVDSYLKSNRNTPRAAVKKKKKKNVSWVESRQSLWYKGCKVRIDSLSNVAEWFKGIPPAHVHWTVESNFAILHYCTILTCPWFSKSTEMKECIPPPVMQITPSVISPLGLIYISARTDLVYCWVIKLHVLVFFKPYEKKNRKMFEVYSVLKPETNTPPAAVKKSIPWVEGRQSLWH